MTLPTPYFETENGVLYCCDSEAIVPFLELPELIITDPPYGIDYQSSWRTDKSKRKAKINGDDKFPLWIFDLKPSNAMFVFCRWDNLKEIPKPKSFIVWDKMTHSMGDLNHEYGRQWEGIAFYPGPDHSFIKRPADIIKCPKVPAEKLIHPNEKPVGVYYPILKAHSGNVLDLFFGSGSVGIACERMGRKWIGVDNDEAHCAIAKKRIIKERQQLRLPGC